MIDCDRGVAFGNPGQSTANLAGERLAYVSDGVIRNNFIVGGYVDAILGVAFFYLAQQNYSLFNGHSGFASVLPPHLFGLDWRTPLPFYFLALGVAVLSYAAVLYLSRSPFGIVWRSKTAMVRCYPRHPARWRRAASRAVSKFLRSFRRAGTHACDYLLACDMEMDPVPGYRFAS